MERGEVWAMIEEQIRRSDLATLVRQLQGSGLRVPGPPATPARAFATDYQPSLTRPTLVTVSAFISCTNAEGQIDVLSDAASPPTTLLDRLAMRNSNAANVYVETPMTFLVLAGHYYRIVTTALGGAPTFAIVRTVELTL